MMGAMDRRFDLLSVTRDATSAARLSSAWRLSTSSLHGGTCQLGTHRRLGEPDTTYSILPTDRLGIRRRTSGGLLLVLLLLDAVDVPEPPLAVALAEPAGPVTEADAVTLTPDEVTSATEVEDPGETDCAATMDSRDHRARRREKKDCILAAILRTEIRICSGLGKGKNECESPRWTERASGEGLGGRSWRGGCR